MSKSALYAANTTSQAVDDGSVISFGSPSRRYGCNIKMSGGNVNVYGSGYYDINTNFTFDADAVGVATISLYKDGTLIPGATASVTTAANTTYSLSIPAYIRQVCNCESTLTAIVSNVAGTITNAAVTVSKL